MRMTPKATHREPKKKKTEKTRARSRIRIKKTKKGLEYVSETILINKSRKYFKKNKKSKTQKGMRTRTRTKQQKKEKYEAMQKRNHNQ